MRIIGLDLGSKTLGVAISDELMFLARTYTTIRFKENDYDECLDKLLEILSKEKVNEVVLGLPKHMNNDMGIRAQITLDFEKKLKENNIVCHLVDERLSTKMAYQNIHDNNYKLKAKKEKKDELAALIILQKYLDKRRF